MVIALFTLNMVTIGLLVIGKPDGPPPHINSLDRGEGPRDIIIKRLDLDEGQIKEYEGLIEDHKAKIKGKTNEMNETRNALYQLLNKPDAERTDSLKSRIGAIQYEIESIHLQHFEDIRGLCQPDQLDAFEDLSSDLAAFFLPPRPKKKTRI